LNEGFGVAHNGVDKLVVCGNGSFDSFVYSSDGLTWTSIGRPLNVTLGDVVYGAGVFVAIGNPTWPNVASVVYSTDGEVWTPIEDKYEDYMISYTDSTIAWSGYEFLISNAGGMFYSTDGIKWLKNSEISVSGGISGGAVAASAGGFDSRPPKPALIAVGRGAMLVAYSYDALTWTHTPFTQFVLDSNQPFGSIAHDGLNMRVATCGTNVSFSHDGFRWTKVLAAQPLPSLEVRSVAWSAGVFVIGGISRVFGGVVATRSSDGFEWTVVPADRTSSAVKAVAHNGTNMFVMVGSGSNSIATSADGTSMVARGSVFAGGGLAVSFGNGVWLAGGQDGTNIIVSSADNGVTWIGRGNVIKSPFSFAYHGGMWVAGGADSTNTLAYSTDNGVNWTGLGTLVFPSSCNSVTYNASLGL
jgi:hypothetical protein